MLRRTALKLLCATPLLDLARPKLQLIPTEPKPLHSHIFFTPEGTVQVRVYVEGLTVTEIPQGDDPSIIEVAGWVGGHCEAYWFFVKKNKMTGVELDRRAGRMMFQDGVFIPFVPEHLTSKLPFVSYTRHECEGDVFRVDIVERP